MNIISPILKTANMYYSDLKIACMVGDLFDINKYIKYSGISAEDNCIIKTVSEYGHNKLVK